MVRCGLVWHGGVWQAWSKGGEKMIYQWKTGFNVKDIDAQRTGEYFDSIEKRDGHVNPKTIIDEAKDEKALLHSCFEWNNNVAAEKYRVAQARNIIGNIITVQVKESPKETLYAKAGVKEEPTQVSSRAFVNVKNAEEKKIYVSIATALNDDTMHDNLLEEAKQELINFKNKYSKLREFAELFSEIDKTLGKVS